MVKKVKKPKPAEIVKKLDSISALKTVSESYRSQLSALIEQAFRDNPELLQEKMDIQQAQDEVVVKLGELTKEVIAAALVLEGKVPLKGAKLQAVFSRGHVTWDNKALAGYALANTEILALKKTGKPSVSLRAVTEDVE